MVLEKNPGQEKAKKYYLYYLYHFKQQKSSYKLTKFCPIPYLFQWNQIQSWPTRFLGFLCHIDKAQGREELPVAEPHQSQRCCEKS